VRKRRERRGCDVNGWDAERIAAAAGATLLRKGSGVPPHPRRVVIDSRAVEPGDLFVGLRGECVDGGAFAAQALHAGAWGVLVAPDRVRTLSEAERQVPAAQAPVAAEAGRHSPSASIPRSASIPVSASGAVLAHPDPLAGLQSLASAWRRELQAAGAKVVGITGSTGKTSTKDILATLLRDAREQLGGPATASPENLNTEIGLPLAILAAPPGTRALVLEMAMRGAGQIAQLTEIARPDVGVIVNVGPVHLQQLGSLEAVAAAKAELIVGMTSGTTAVVPADEPLLAPHLRADLRTVRFGAGGDVELEGRSTDGEVTIVDRAGGARASGAAIDGAGAGIGGARMAGGTDRPAGVDRAGGDGERIVLRPSFAQSHNLRNLLAAVAAARALGVTPNGRLDVQFAALRGERLELPNGIVLINDCYNANPMSMRAALDELAASEAGRRVAVLGDMLELGPDEQRLHREIGAYAHARGVELLLTVGPLAREMGEEWDGSVYSVAKAPEAAELLGRLLRVGDLVLVKGSRGIGLERVAQELGAEVAGGGDIAPASNPRATAPAPGIPAVARAPGTPAPAPGTQAPAPDVQAVATAPGVWAVAPRTSAAERGS
jgi:UDP-N-acetylmuramoyl-tripeptide--D-alanyl-D-alanine ligase